jgi:hypothetical protein
MKRLLNTDSTVVMGPGELVLEVSQNEFGKWALEFTLLLEGLTKITDMRIGKNRICIRGGERRRWDLGTDDNRGGEAKALSPRQGNKEHGRPQRDVQVGTRRAIIRANCTWPESRPD